MPLISSGNHACQVPHEKQIISRGNYFFLDSDENESIIKASWGARWQCGECSIVWELSTSGEWLRADYPEIRTINYGRSER